MRMITGGRLAWFKPKRDAELYDVLYLPNSL